MAHRGWITGGACSVAPSTAVRALFDPKVLGLQNGAFQADDALVLVASPYFETARFISPFVQFAVRSSQRIAGTVFVVAKPGLSLVQGDEGATDAFLDELEARVRPAVLLYSASVIDLTPYHFSNIDETWGARLWASLVDEVVPNCDEFKVKLVAIPEFLIRPPYQLF